MGTEASEPSKSLALFIQGKFSSYAQARESSGIERKWENALNAFEGRYQKESQTDGEESRSKIYVQVTRSKCIAAFANISAALFQTGALPYEIKNTPLPDSVNEYLEFLGISTHDSLEAMKAKLDDQFAEAGVIRVLNNAILDLIVYGTAFVRSPVPKRVSRNHYNIAMPPGMRLPSMEEMQNFATSQSEDPEEQKQFFEELRLMVRAQVLQIGQFELQTKQEVIPAIAHYEIWDAFPDPDMRDPSVQLGDGFIHRSLMTRVQLMKMREIGQYDVEAIDRCLGTSRPTGTSSGFESEGSINPRRQEITNSSIEFELLEFSGLIRKSDLLKHVDDVDRKQMEEGEPDELVEAMVTVCGEEVFRAQLNPYEERIRPFFLCPYEQVSHRTWGRGIPENIADSQSLINGLTRSFVEGKKMSSSLQVAVKPANLEVGHDLNLYPNKTWRLAKHATSIDEAIQWFAPPDTTSGTLDAIFQFRQMADEDSGLPRVIEGKQSLKPTESTAFEVSKLVNAANLQLEKVIKNIDEYWLINVVQTFYRWNMLQNGNEFKGDFLIKATGFQQFKDRAEKGQKIDMILAGYAQDPELRLMLKLQDLLREKLRTIDMSEFMWDPERIQQIQEEQQAAAEAAQQAAQQAELDAAAALQQQKFDQSVVKKSEVAATKDAIEKERNIKEGEEEIEKAGLGAEFDKMTADAQDQQIAATLNELSRAANPRSV